MNLPVLIVASITFLLGISLIVLLSQKGKQKKTIARLQVFKENHEYLVNSLHDVIDIAGFGKDLESVVDTLTKSIGETFPYSTLSSIYIKKPKLVFRSVIAETVSHAFINHIKDTMLTTLNTSITAEDPTKPAPQAGPQIHYDSDSIEENLTGEQLDDMGISEIKSSIEIKLTINNHPQAIINLTSTSENAYSEEDKLLFSTISELVSGFLSRLDLLLNFEESKSLSMIDSFSEGIFMIDKSINLVSMNNSAKNFMNLHGSNTSIKDILSTLPNTYNFRDKIEQCITGNQRIEETDVIINNKAFKVILTPVLEVNSATRNTIGASVLLHDITLEKSLARTKEDFTNIMVHELRSPLTAIKASSEFLTSQADLTHEEKKRLIEMISISSKKMLDEISLILDSAKMDAGLFTIRKTDSDLKKLITDRISVFTPVAAEKTITLRTEIDPTIPIFSFDPVRIDEVINNLLSNSLKFTPENGSISIKAGMTGEKVTVSVTDTGQGIAKDKQGALFARYQQAPAEGTHVGTGLGLYVVKQVVEDHGGAVTLDSDLGQGTTISFTLPLHTQAAVPAETPAAPAVHTEENPQRLVN
ncbi:MAG TPA: HAMP domain-containing sensor histidine kinase [Xanthomonadales bacterium]|nr:HAMP domain-containing sensor histidine kinase [Xanthomonadales bacterium]